jgi:tight adherence protein B
MNTFVVVALGLAAVFADRGVRVWRHDGTVLRLTGPLTSRGPTSADRISARTLASRARGSWVVWSIVAAIAGFALHGPVFAAIAAVAARGAWAIRIKRRTARIVAERDEQLGDAVRALASSLRAGMSTTQAIAYAETESVAPLVESLAAMRTSLDLGVPFDDALARWTDDVDSDDARLVAGVLRMHRRSGGDLPSVLDQVADTLRERQAAAREIRALTAQARLSGTILGVLPIGFLAFLWLTSRAQIEGAFRTPAGIASLTLGLVLEGLAFLWIRRLLEVR